MLTEVDPKSALQIHTNNIKRTIRALEFYHQTGMKISEHNEAEREKESPYQYAYFVLTDDRAKLYERIDRRVDLMMESGLEEEVRFLKDRGVSSTSTAMQGLGYKEPIGYKNRFLLQSKEFFPFHKSVPFPQEPASENEQH